ncbi:hypothetical protein ACB094_09G044000 [Castanea mollissima]
MEERESTVSGSLGNSDTDSPPAPLSNMAAVNTSLGVSTTTTTMVMMTETNTNTDTTTKATTATTTTPVSSGDLLGKKKRGRPRKYDADGNLRVSYTAAQPPPGFTLSPSDFSSSKRGRGRPPGSGNWQLLASLGELFANTAGGDFTPHVVTVNTGEDVAAKILSFSQKGPRGICVLSANGAISNVTIRQPGSSGGILTYEGRFEILSLSGSFTVTDNGGMRSRTGGLSVSLAGPDGRVIGGGIAGLLTAAGPLQIVVGSFMPYGYKAHKRKHHREHSLTSPISGAPAMLTAASPISQAKPDVDNFFNATSPLPAQKHEEADDNSDKQNQNATLISSGWNGLEPTAVQSVQRPSPDINISAPGE